MLFCFYSQSVLWYLIYGWKTWFDIGIYLNHFRNLSLAISPIYQDLKKTGLRWKNNAFPLDEWALVRLSCRVALFRDYNMKTTNTTMWSQKQWAVISSKQKVQHNKSESNSIIMTNLHQARNQQWSMIHEGQMTETHKLSSSPTNTRFQPADFLKAWLNSEPHRQWHLY